jgi:hypothetical protein
VFVREQSNNLYSPTAYFLGNCPRASLFFLGATHSFVLRTGKTLIDLPVEFVALCIYCTLCYYLVSNHLVKNRLEFISAFLQMGLRPGFAFFAKFTGILVLVAYAGQSIGCVSICLVPPTCS